MKYLGKRYYPLDDASNRGSRRDVPHKGTSYSPKYTSYGSIGTAKQIDRFGSGMMKVGAAQIAAAHLAMPSSNKMIWEPMTRKQVKLHRPSQLTDGKKYDYRPRGSRPFDGIRDANLFQRRRKSGRGGIQTEHHRRGRGVHAGTTIYSEPTAADVKSHRQKIRRKGLGKAGAGGVLRMVGKGFVFYSLATYTKWLYDDPSTMTGAEIIYDATGASLLEYAGVNPTTTPTSFVVGLQKFAKNPMRYLSFYPTDSIDLSSSK